MINTEAKESMNSEIKVSAYVVSIKDLANPSRYTPRTFQDADLLSARQSAIEHVQQVLTKRLAHQVLEVLIELVEVERSSVGGKHQVIATVFHQTFFRTMFFQNGKCLLKDAKLSPLEIKSLPPELFKTVGLHDDSYNSPEAVWHSLEELEKEAGYYQKNGFSSGFGYAQIDRLAEHNSFIQTKDLTAVTINSYVVLYDAFAYASSLIGKYNDQLTDCDSILSSNTQFLSPQYYLEETH